MIRKFFLALAVFLAFFTCQPTAKAAELENKSALAVTPSIVQRIVGPGEKGSFKLEITNVTNQPLPVHLSTAPLEGSPYQDDPVQKWITFSEPDLILQPKKTKTETAIVQPPVNAEPGGHYASLYITPLVPVDILSSMQARQIVRVGVTTFVVVKGDIEEKLNLEKFSTNKGVQDATPVDFLLRINNSGNVHQLAHGKITIYNGLGKQVATLDMPDTVILPKSSKTIPVSWNKPWAFGSYSAKAEITYGTKHVSVESPQITFWVIPWLPILLLLTVLIFVVHFMRRTYRRWWRAIKALAGK